MNEEEEEEEEEERRYRRRKKKKRHLHNRMTIKQNKVEISHLFSQLCIPIGTSQCHDGLLRDLGVKNTNEDSPKRIRNEAKNEPNLTNNNTKQNKTKQQQHQQQQQHNLICLQNQLLKLSRRQKARNHFRGGHL
jgi:hypothetical protein